MSGRTVPDPGFAGDLGAADPRLRAALAAWRVDASQEGELLAALTAARVLVPVVAVLVEADAAAPGDLRREEATDMALVTLVADGGHRALPVFTSLETLARWRSDARPVPVEAPRAALSAAAEGCRALVVDVGGPTSYVVPGALLEPLARGWLAAPAAADAAFAAQVAQAVVDEPLIAGVRVVPAPGVDARVEVTLAEALPPAQLRALGERLSAALRQTVTRPLLRGLDLGLLPPVSGGPGR